MKRFVTFLLLLLFFSFTLFLTFNRHSKSGINNYHSEIWADKAGYYVYLPALFIYNFSGEQMPEDIDMLTGNGFTIQDEVIKTKYTYGVALMQLPFFITGHWLSETLGYENDGFSLIYHKIINVSAVVYSWLGLILLYIFLIRYVKKTTAILTLACVYLGTNVFYYSVFDTGMSHIYSFFLFSAFLYISPQILKPKTRFTTLLLFGFITGLIIMVRPINMIFLPVYFFFNKVSFKEIKEYTKQLSVIVAVALLVMIPQFLYWEYSTGNYVSYSYEGEGFTNILKPRIAELWFSTNNGLLIFNPIVIFILAGIVYMYRQSRLKSLLLGGYFLLISLLFASWHDWTYGCSYGSRPFTEYMALLSFPFSLFIQKHTSKTMISYVSVLLIILLIVYNLKLVFSYDGCWYGGIWDWNELIKLLTGPTK